MSLPLLLESLTQRGIRLYLEDEKLRYVAPPNAMDDGILLELKKYKSDLVEMLVAEESIHLEKDSPSTANINASQRLAGDTTSSGLSPASLSQKSLWFLDKMGVPPETYALHMSWRIDGPLDIEILEQSVEKLIERHPSFRTAFVEIDDELMQKICPPTNFNLSVIDASKGDSWGSLASELIAQPFDLSAGELLRGQVYKHTVTQFTVCFVTHHIVMDGWSVAIFTQELERLYRALNDGKAAQLEKIIYQHTNFAEEQLGQQKAKKFDHALKYWKKELSNSPSVVPLPFDYSRPAQPSYSGGAVVRKLPLELMDRVHSISRDLEATPYVVLLSIFKAFLYRYSGESDIVVGTPVANRGDVNWQNSIGFFMNTVVVRSKVQPNWRLQDLIRSVKAFRHESMPHESLPFELLVQELEPVRNLNIHPIFQTLFVFQNATGNPLSLPGMEVQQIEHIGRQVAKFDLAFEIRPSHSGGYEYNLNYSLDIFSGHSIDLMADCLDEFVLNATADPKKSIGGLHILPEQQFREVTRLSKGDSIPLNKSQTIHEKFQQQCIATPDDDIVGVSLERSPDYVATIIAILECGAVWLPLDTGYPLATLSYMFNDSEAALLVHHPKSELVKHVAKATENPINCVLGTHVGALNRFSWMWREYPFTKSDINCIKTPISFVDSIWEIFGALLQGNLSVMIPMEAAANPEELLKQLKEHSVTRLLAVPSLLSLLMDQIQKTPFLKPNLNVCISSGEKLSPELALRVKTVLTDTILLNLYGSSEVSADVSCYCIVKANDNDLLPVGRPIDNTQIYVLDNKQQHTPIGVKGEVYVGGVGVAAGYHNDKSISGRSFVTNPFGSGQLYRTGDLGYWSKLGELILTGREDRQVKIRGVRTECGQVESAIEQHPDISRCSVVPIEIEPGHIELHAAVESIVGVSLTKADLFSYLRDRIQPYMVPSSIQLYSSLPELPNGKVDLKTIVAEVSKSYSTGHIPFEESLSKIPGTDIEQRMLLLWREVLNNLEFGIDDTFFEFGGHSLLAVKLVSRVNEVFHVELPLASIFKDQTVRAMASTVERTFHSPSEHTLMPMRMSEGSECIFLIPPSGSTGFFYESLCTHIAKDLNVYSFDTLTAKNFDSLESLAAHYLNLMLSIQEKGPWNIAGACFGNHIALEITRQLNHLQRGDVNLFLIDSNPPLNGPTWDSNALFTTGVRPTAKQYFWILIEGLRQDFGLKLLFKRYRRIRAKFDSVYQEYNQAARAQSRQFEGYRAKVVDASCYLFLSKEFHSIPQNVSRWQQLVSSECVVINMSARYHWQLARKNSPHWRGIAVRMNQVMSCSKNGQVVES